MAGERMREKRVIEGNYGPQFGRDIERVRVLQSVSSKQPMLAIILSPVESHSVVGRLVSPIPEEPCVSTVQILTEFELVKERVTVQRKVGIPALIGFLLQAWQNRCRRQVIPMSQRLLVEKRISEAKFRKSNGDHARIPPRKVRR